VAARRKCKSRAQVRGRASGVVLHAVVRRPGRRAIMAGCADYCRVGVGSALLLLLYGFVQSSIRNCGTRENSLVLFVIKISE
jgi:hypothetical protein